MIANDGLSGSAFGTGRLLDDLVQFVYSGMGCRLLLMGDTAQLPPVGEEQSPALFADALKGYGLEVQEVDLTQVVRQEQQSGILWNATRLRQLIAEDACEALPKIKVAGFADIKVLPGDELIDALETCYDRDGLDETIVICRSNKRANIYNNGIRSRILWREDELNTGDLLMVAKNNYYWTEKQKEMDFIANGGQRWCAVCAAPANCMVSVLRMSRWNFPITTTSNWKQIFCWIHCTAMRLHCPRRITTAFSIPFSKIMPISP